MTEHHSSFRKNFEDNEMQVVCDCGWSSACDNYLEGHRLFAAHKAPKPVPAVSVKLAGTCPDCTGFYDEAMGATVHKDNCPSLRVASLAAKRFEKTRNPAQVSVIDVLDAAKAYILDQPEDDRAEHVIVFIGRTTKDGGSATKYFQGGAYSAHAQRGLCYEATKMMSES